MDKPPEPRAPYHDTCLEMDLAAVINRHISAGSLNPQHAAATLAHMSLDTLRYLAWTPAAVAAARDSLREAIRHFSAA